jgi:2-C-methyl-D-erythritol 4-phosphate cytidylyltransferase
MSTFAVILPAAGQSSRFRDPNYKKPFAPLDNRAVWLHSAERFLNRNDVKQLLVVISDEDREEFDSKFAANVAILGIEVVAGGAQRADSVKNALARVRPKIEFVAVHDAARPVLADAWIDDVFDAARKTKAAILATPISGTIKKVNSNHTIAETVSRENLYEAQTPQVFARKLLVDAYARYSGPPATDEAQVVEKFGHAVTVVNGSPLNVKITTKADLQFASAAIKALPKPKNLSAMNPFADGDIWR